MIEVALIEILSIRIKNITGTSLHPSSTTLTGIPLQRNLYSIVFVCVKIDILFKLTVPVDGRCAG